MDLETLQPLLVGWVRSLTEVDVVLFENAPRPHHSGTLVLLSWVSMVSVGVEDQRYEDSERSAPALNLTPQTVGLRLVTLQLSIETLSQRPGAPNAFTLAERFRSRARCPASLAAIAAMALGLVRVGSTLKADYRVDQRWVSRVIVEVRFNATAFETSSPINTIETAKVSTALKNPAGDDLPVALQISEEVLP